MKNCKGASILSGRFCFVMEQAGLIVCIGLDERGYNKRYEQSAHLWL